MDLGLEKPNLCIVPGREEPGQEDQKERNRRVHPADPIVTALKKCRYGRVIWTCLHLAPLSARAGVSGARWRPAEQPDHAHERAGNERKPSKTMIARPFT